MNINELHLGEHLTAADLELPDGVELVTPTDTVVAHIEEPKSIDEPIGGADEVEPEVISKGGDKKEGED